MRTDQVAAAFLVVALFLVTPVGRSASAQAVRVEVGSGWVLPSSDITMRVQGQQVGPSVDPGSGPNAYGALGLVWGISDNFSLEGRLRAQQTWMRVDAEDFSGVARCVNSCPDGRLWGVSIEGQITLTSVGRINPYVLIGLGVVQTTIDGVRVATPRGEEFQLSEVDVTDAGGDVGFGATTRITGGLRLTAETRVTGSLPGAKENAITTFPFTLGLSYEF